MKTFQEYINESVTSSTHSSEDEAIAKVNDHKAALEKEGYSEGRHKFTGNHFTGGSHVEIPFKHPDGRTAIINHIHNGKGSREVSIQK